jgi:hypothetical protein
MKKLLVTAVVVLGLGFLAAIIYSLGVTGSRNTLNNELNDVKNSLASTQDALKIADNSLGLLREELTSTKAQLASTNMTLTLTQYTLTSTNQTLVSTQADLDSKNQALSSAQADLGLAKQTLASAQQAQTSLTTQLSDAQKKLASAEETLGGLGIILSSSNECFDVTLVDNPAAKNPTWQQLTTFLARDKTENHVYIANKYDCSQFSRDVHNNAEAAGIRAAEVDVMFKDEKSGHALNAFLTSDCGLVYVDCTQAPDKIARIKTGKAFRSVDAAWVFNTSIIADDAWWDKQNEYYYIKSSTGGQVITSDITIFW